VFDCVRVDAGSTWRAGTRADAGGGVRGATPEVRFRGPHGLPEPRVRARRGGSPPAAHARRPRPPAADGGPAGRPGVVWGSDHIRPAPPPRLPSVAGDLSWSVIVGPTAATR